jgi:ubiquinone biosynthesis protein
MRLGPNLPNRISGPVPEPLMKLTSLPQFARNANRLGEIVAVLSKYGLADGIDRLGLGVARGLFKGSDGSRLSEQTREKRIRLVLSELGPTFIKFGQMLSTRPDVVGPALAEELTLLQNCAPADPPDRIRSIIEAELGQPVEELFAHFDPEPLASASIAQVHQARLKSGELVVVKVQHVGIEAKIRVDLDILLGLARLAETYMPELKQYRPRSTAAEFQRVILRELDFGREERNLQQFVHAFAANPTVHFPHPHPDLTTSRVLTMEFLDGVRLADSDSLRTLGLDLEQLARRGALVFLDMIFRDGFFHGDPHPGNILILAGGVIGLLDCGMVGHLDESLREALSEMLVAIGRRDAQYLTSIIVRTAVTPSDLDETALSNDVAEFLAYHASQSLEQFNLGRALNELTELIRRHQIVLPAGLAMLIKVLVMLEGTSRLLSPRFELAGLIREYLQRTAWRRFSPVRRMQGWLRFYREWRHLGEILPRNLTAILSQVQRGKFDVHLDHRRLEPSVNRLVLGMLTSALFLGSAVLESLRVPPVVADVSLTGLAGILLSALLGLRLLWAIRKSGKLDG